MWAERIHNLQIRRLSGNDLEYLNLNMSLHYAKFFMILFSVNESTADKQSSNINSSDLL